MKIAFLILPNMLSTSMSNAFELFFAANEVEKMRHGRNALQAKLVKVATAPQRLEMRSGLSLLPDEIISETVFDIVYVPALWRNPKPIVNRHNSVIDWLRWQYEHGAIINGTGTGVRFIAETGLLDERPATTHWHHFESFAADFPMIELKRQHFITSAGRLFCAASINAQTDLTLHHIHRVFSKETSDHLARHFSHEVRQPFDRLSFTQENNSNHPDELILQSQLWMQNNLSRADVSMLEIARIFGMSSRNFSRRFRQATNLSPLQYLQGKRFEEARELLKNSNLSITEIAYRVGYSDVSYFTKLFKQLSSSTPKDYRKTVRAKLFSSHES